MILYLQLLVLLIGVESSQNGNCSDVSSSGTKKWFCCDNHEEVNNTCIECLNGFESFDGRPCKPCPDGFHGKDCAFQCHCKDTQLCDHIMGCIMKQQNITEEVAESTVTVQYTSTMTEIDIDITSLTTVLPPTFKASMMTFTEKYTTVGITTRQIKTTTTKTTENNLGFSNREIIVYSICAGGFVCVILLCTVCQRRYKQMYGNFRRYKTGKKRRRNIPEVSLPEIPLEASEGIYEIIDESNMIDNFEIIRKRRSLVSNTDESYVEPNSNGYLTPYQPVDEGLNTNDLKDTKSEFSENGSNDQGTGDGASTSSSSEVDGRRSSYLNPYQPIVHSGDIHEYSSTHNMNESGSSGSEAITRESGYLNPYQPIVHSADIHEYSSTNNMNESGSSGSETTTRESGYLNPYQPMVPDRDLHDYKSVLDSTVGSDSEVSDECTKEIVVHSYQDLKSEIDTHEYKSVSSMSIDTHEYKSVSSMSIDTHEYKSVSSMSIDTHEYKSVSSMSIDTHEYKSVSSMSIDTVTKDDSSKNVQIKTENEYLHME
ncbi:unnamed protein product [Mytilus edulis]|uniref:Uncharacterized protein n=1 Tax=Mytilus edulis TaxID=6550 RepID=A0A8S3PTK4_MYTED|nr:unnamed protein product [Mytilus edulis]